MNTTRSVRSPRCNVVARTLVLASLGVALGFSTSFAATVTWNGTDGEYTTGSNWSTSSVPNTNAGDTARITAGAVTYTAGGDLPIHAGGTLQISGGSWTQAGGVAWIQMSGGNILVDGGIFNQGTAGNIIRNATSSITVTAGTANLNGNYINEVATSGTLSISGTGTVNIAGEFKPIESFTLSGGALSANLISFADGPGSVNVSSGTISLDGSGGNSGFYGGGGGKSLNFTEGSTGSLFFRSYTLTELTSDGFMTNGTITYAGAIDGAKFNLSETGGGVLVSAISAVPEPSTYAALAGLAILAGTVVRRRKHN